MFHNRLKDGKKKRFKLAQICTALQDAEVRVAEARQFNLMVVCGGRTAVNSGGRTAVNSGGERGDGWSQRRRLRMADWE